MKPLVLITRPQPEADEFASAVRALGYAALCEPLLDIERLPAADDFSCDALIVTSPQALYAPLPPHLPLFVMGRASEEKARALGAERVFSSEGDFTRLVALVKGTMATGSRVLYLRGDVTRHDMADALPEHEISERIAYRAVPRAALSGEARALISSGQVGVVTLFSPRTAALFQNLVQSEGLTGRMAGINLLCLSPAVLDSIDALTWARTDVAPSTDSEGMLAVLKNRIGSFS